MNTDSSTGKSWMPSLIVCITLAGFFTAEFFIMYKVFGDEKLVNLDVKEAMTMLGMLVVASINLATGAVGYWLGKNHSDQVKDQMIYNSTPTPEPTRQVTTSTMTTQSSVEPVAAPIPSAAVAASAPSPTVPPAGTVTPEVKT